MKDDRRAFLKTVGGVSAAALGTTALPRAGGAAQVEAAAAGPGTTFSATRFVLELDKSQDLLRSFAGGNASAQVVTEAHGVGCTDRKHLAGVEYGDIDLTVAPLPGKSLQKWISDALGCTHLAQDGAVLGVDINFTEQRRLEFIQALLTEISLPALDVSSKAPGYFQLKLKPEATQLKIGKGEKVPSVGTKAKNWLVSHFRFKIDGLDATRVSKIDGLVIKQKPLEFEVGETREIAAGKVEVGDIEVTLSEVSAKTWYEWFKTFVLEGQSSSEFEKNGTIEVLMPNLKTVLFTVELLGLGIYSLATPANESGSDKVATVVAKMYCQELKLKFA